MTTLHQALTWSGSGAELIVFAVWTQEPPPVAQDLAVGSARPVRVRAYDLEAPDDALSGTVQEIDLRFAEVPDDLEQIVTGALHGLVGAGATVAWFGFETSFGFDHLLCEHVAPQVYAVADSTRTPLARGDVRRRSPAWATEVGTFRELVLGPAAHPSGSFGVLRTDDDGLATAVYRWRAAGRDVRVVRGSRARTVDTMMDEVAAAVQFPLYAAHSWPSFAECVSELDWIDPRRGLAVVLSAADEVLADEPAIELGALVRALTGTATTWASPVEQCQWWDRPAVAFEVVLQSSTDQRERYEAAGAILHEVAPPAADPPTTAG